MRSFRRLASVRATPSRTGLSRRESGLTLVSCQWRVVLLRAVGARRQQPPVCGCQSDVVATDPNHGPSRSFAHGRLPHGTHARLHSRVTVEATAVERTATPAVANGQREGKVDTPERQNAERLGVKRRRLPGWERHERGRRERARLGPQQRSLLHWEGGHQHVLPEIQLQTLCCELLGPVLISRLPYRKPAANSSHEGGWKPDRRSGWFTDRHAFNVVRWVVCDDASQDGPAHLRVTLVHHVNAISPTAPASCVPHQQGAVQPQSSH